MTPQNYSGPGFSIPFCQAIPKPAAFLFSTVDSLSTRLTFSTNDGRLVPPSHVLFGPRIDLILDLLPLALLASFFLRARGPRIQIGLVFFGQNRPSNLCPTGFTRLPNTGVPRAISNELVVLLPPHFP